jgi:ABC-type Fe3+ transport system substrate-binding protein
MHQLQGVLLTSAAIISLLASACAPAAPAPSAPPAPTAAAANPVAAQATSSGAELLAKLVAAARTEQQVRLVPGAELAPHIDALTGAFNKRFGLQPSFSFDWGSQSEKFGPAIVALKAGAPQQFDALNGPDDYVLRFVRAGGASEIDGWQTLLAEINPDVSSGKLKAEDLSPNPFSGMGFRWANRLNVLIYNPRLLAAVDLPAAHTDLANPKYKGKLVVPPWITSMTPAIMVHDRDQWLAAVDNIGKNTGTVDKYQGASQRVVAGEFPLGFANLSDYFTVKRSDPNAPIAYHLFKDYTDVSYQMYVVPKGGPGYHTAVLWALWMTTPEAHAIRQKGDLLSHQVSPVTELDMQYQQIREKGDTHFVSWFDTRETLQLFDWLGTPEGEAYSNALTQNLTQRK